MARRSPFWRAYWWLEPRLAPGLRYAQREFEDSLFAVVSPGCRWLDLGCGHSLLPPWRAAQERELTARPSALVGVDPELSALQRHGGLSMRVCGHGANLPFVNGDFDLVTANMVVEHLDDPASQFREIARVLKPGGRFVFHTPNGTGYPTLMAKMVPDPVRALGARVVEKRGDDDRFPTFYRANTRESIAQIASAAGFEVERIDLVRSTPMFPLVTPIAAVELVVLRAMASPRLAWLRPNLIAVLRKHGSSARKAAS